MEFDALAEARKYTGKLRAVEVEMAVRSDLNRGKVPSSWYYSLKQLKWDADKFLEIIKEQVEENKDANRKIDSDIRSECEEDGNRRGDLPKEGLA